MQIFSQLTILIAALLLYPMASYAQDDVREVYTLDGGDKLRVTVFEEEDLSGEFEVDGSGVISLPLIGNIEAGGLTLRQLESAIYDSLKDGYLINPKINIEVLDFRSFFIMGEVKKPGGYPYINALTVLNAVALAGGYTPRAKEGNVTIHRKQGNKIEDLKANEAAKVFPGDTIRVMERFF